MEAFARNPEKDYSVSELGGPSEVNARETRVLGSVFNIDQRYKVINTLGSGAYGVVVSAKDTHTDQLVAIKKIEKAFENSTFTKRTLRELKILRLLSHENIIKVKTIQLPRCREQRNLRCERTS